ncbi:SRPBCC domain-containing protein [Niabella pedocola]|uniref:SRPBCC domain-containing protein n=1 Tax=Niabella pedocola TaxID=1752077 RepID=A0ABS8PKB0_9BACT|nr:SRPBCC domain-containing protein [Niabella pedocola]MCD2421544.1 SRPBCC domain-containing protein [Niabella pedocola]
MPAIHHAVLIGAPAAQVYKAITSQEGLRAWWTPGTTAKPELGSMARFPFGPVYFKTMKITVLKPQEEVCWICTAGAGEWIDTHISFTLYTGDQQQLGNRYPEIGGQLEQQKDKGAATLLLFRHEAWKTYSLMFAECSYTWGRFLSSLKRYCETGKGRPWPHQHEPE